MTAGIVISLTACGNNATVSQEITTVEEQEITSSEQETTVSDQETATSEQEITTLAEEKANEEEVTQEVTSESLEQPEQLTSAQEAFAAEKRENHPQENNEAKEVLESAMNNNEKSAVDSTEKKQVINQNNQAADNNNNNTATTAVNNTKFPEDTVAENAPEGNIPEKPSEAGTSSGKQKPSGDKSGTGKEKKEKKEKKSEETAQTTTTSADGQQTTTAATKKQTATTIATTKQETTTTKKQGTATYDTSSSYGAVALTNGQTITGGTYTATGTDESAIEASGTVKATVTGSIINKTDGSASSADDSSFKGVNSAVRVYGNATVTLKDVTVNATASNATGVFAYDGGTVNISDSTVNVTGGGAGGIQVAGGGTLYASNLIVKSASKAAIRSDRGGGIMVVDGGTYTSTGSNGCPAIYSTADITVKNATLVSENSRAVIIEGKNSVKLTDCDLTGNDQSTKTGSVKANVLLYQSASGDASEGTSLFTMTGGSITSKSGAMFYCTNTSSVINLTDAELNLSTDGSLLIVSEGRWGKDGSNGGDVEFNVKNQKLTGSITVDSISTLELNMTSSSYTGAINESGAAGKVSVSLDSNSTWTLDGNSYITSFDGDLSNVNTNGYHLYVNGTLAK